VENQAHTYVAILAGGTGTRLWPKSLIEKPKQFLDILGIGKTLIQQAFEHYISFIKKENIFVITHQDYFSIIREQLPELPIENIILEPSQKHTAPSTMYISMKLWTRDPEANLVIAPSDQIILDQKSFENTIEKALDFSAHITDSLIALGAQPTYPNISYGYIQFGTKEVVPNIYKLKTFTEKPNAELAKVFIDSGEFLWNTGIFVFRAKSVLNAMEKYLPELYEVFISEKEFFNTDREKEIVEKIYSLCTNISIDFAILEKSENVYVIPSSFGWSDIGSWDSVYEDMQKDYLGNAVSGKHVLVVDATKCMVNAPDKKLIILQGLDDFVVVDTQNILLICKKDKVPEIKDYVAEVKRNFDEDYL